MAFDDIDLTLGATVSTDFGTSFNTLDNCSTNPTTFTQSCTCPTCTLGNCPHLPL